MEAIGLFFSKFSDELISAQIALLSLSFAVGLYVMLVRKKKRETAEWVPAALVRAYLDRMYADERETRIKLFGDAGGYTAHSSGSMPLTQMLHSAVPVSGGASVDPALAKEVEALRAQLAMADSRAMELDRTLNGLRAEKTGLEKKLKDAASTPAAAAPAAASAGPDPAMVKELDDLRGKLKEYEVIEDDLANLKKFQKENEQLRQKIGQMEGGGAALKVLDGGKAAGDVSATVANATQKIDTPVTVVSAAPAAAAPAAAPAPVAAAPAAPAAGPSGETNTNVLAPINPTVGTAAPAAPAADGKSSKQKEEELLSEFEKMLAS
ncbi:MAG TPA: hypothetical protein VIH99_02845 [Bdellovibrionota bacterium]|jgi:hypothetical protein